MSDSMAAMMVTLTRLNADEATLERLVATTTANMENAARDRDEAHAKVLVAIGERAAAERALIAVRAERARISASLHASFPPLHKHALTAFLESRHGSRADVSELRPDEFASMRQVQTSCERENGGLGLCRWTPRPPATSSCVARGSLIPAASPCFDQDAALPFQRGMSRVWGRRIVDRVRREGAALEAVILGYKRHPDRGKPLLCSACGNIIENEFFVCVYETGLKVHVACGWFAMVSEPSGAEPTASKSQSR